MLNSDYLLSEETLAEDQWTDALTTELEFWADSNSHECEFDLALHRLPTDQELMDMEADNAMLRLDDNLIKKERRTALRH